MTNKKQRGIRELEMSGKVNDIGMSAEGNLNFQNHDLNFEITHPGPKTHRSKNVSINDQVYMQPADDNSFNSSLINRLDK